MRIWVTRPLDDAQAMKAHLIARGHEAFIEPLINVQYGCEDPIDLEDAQCLVATSRNGVRALAQAPEFEYARLLPLFAVGPGTATVAKALGFMDVIEGPGRANELVDVICERAGVNSGPIVCLLGDHKAFDLPGELVRLGFQVFAPIVYHTSAAASLSGALVARLERGEIDSVLLLSPRTARTYVLLAKLHNLLEECRALCHICLSDKVARELRPLQCDNVVIAARPNLQEVLALLPDKDSQSP